MMDYLLDNSVIIDAAEFPKKDSYNRYGITIAAYSQIYQFYADAKHSQKNIYIFDSDSYSYRENVLVSSEIGTYNRVGILFDGDSFTMSRDYILFLRDADLQSKDAVNLAIERQSKELNCDRFTYIAVEKVYQNSIARKRDAELIHEVLPYCIVMNSGFRVESTVVDSAVRKNSIDLAELFNQYNVCTKTMVNNVKAVKELCDAILETKPEGKMYHLNQQNLNYDNSGKARCAAVYVRIAAYFMATEGMEFELDGHQIKFVETLLSRFVSREYNYLDDYLKLVANPIDLGIIFRDRNAYFCVKNLRALKTDPERYQPYVGIIETDVMLEEAQINTNDLSSRTYRLADLEVLSLENTFNLTSADWGAAVEGLNQLNKLLSKFEKCLNQKLLICNSDSLCLSNVLLYRVNGEMKLGYVTNISGKMPYTIMPVDTSFATFQEELDLNDYVLLYDTNVMADSKAYVKVFLEHKWVLDGNLHYNYPKHCIGSVLDGLEVLNSAFSTLKDYVTVEELGIWSPVTMQFRGNKAKPLFKYVTPAAARDTEVLTYFGGPFPNKYTKYVLGPRAWR